MTLLGNKEATLMLLCTQFIIIIFTKSITYKSMRNNLLFVLPEGHF